MRRRMMEFGLQNMPLVDIVELILYFTIPRGDVKYIAEELINRFGTIDRMAKASSAERLSIPGVSKRTDEHFAMIGMFIPNVLRGRLGEYPVLDSYLKIMEMCKALHVMNEYEVLYVMCLNAGMHLIKKETKLTVGTPGHMNVELKHIMDTVANTSTVNVILCHNHPSGNLVPSTDDLDFTSLVASSLDRIGINLYDHVIVADNSAFSMREEGMLEFMSNVY